MTTAEVEALYREYQAARVAAEAAMAEYAAARQTRTNGAVLEESRVKARGAMHRATDLYEAWRQAPA